MSINLYFSEVTVHFKCCNIFMMIHANKQTLIPSRVCECFLVDFSCLFSYFMIVVIGDLWLENILDCGLVRSDGLQFFWMILYGNIHFFFSCWNFDEENFWDENQSRHLLVKVHDLIISSWGHLYHRVKNICWYLGDNVCKIIVWQNTFGNQRLSNLQRHIFSTYI